MAFKCEVLHFINLLIAQTLHNQTIKNAIRKWLNILHGRCPHSRHIMKIWVTSCSAIGRPCNMWCLSLDLVTRAFYRVYIFPFWKFPLASMGVLSHRLRTLDRSLVPPSTWAEIFRRTCLQSHLQTSPPTPQKSYPKFRNTRQLLKLPPLSAQKCHSAEGRGGPRI